jgi:hypothetical protein
MNALFDTAALAIVAYAKVDGHTGASTKTNSGGVKTAKRLGGGYYVSLSPSLTQDPTRDLILIQATAKSPPAPADLAAPIVIDQQNATKIVMFGLATTIVDSDFTVIIFRTTITPPTGAPA